jgi:carboxyl-terminal processing protease
MFMLNPKMKFHTLGILSIIFVIGLLGNESQAQRRNFSFVSKVGLSCKHLNVIAQGFLHQHIQYDEFNPELSDRTAEQYIKKLDPFKLYLTKADYNKIKNILNRDSDSIKKALKSAKSETAKKAVERGLFGKIKRKECADLTAARKVYEERVNARVKFVKKYLNSGFKLDKKTKINLDPDVRDYGKTVSASRNYHKKYIQFQVTNNMAAGEKLDKAKASVIKKYERALKRIGEVNQEDIFSNYLDSFARALDPHSSYFSKDVLEDFEISMRLELEGIGATLSSEDGFTVVEQLISGGAAKKSGLIKSQDKIIGVGQIEDGKDQAIENVVEMDLRDVVKKIRGPKGSKVRLKILRREGASTETMIVTLTRDKIKLEDEAASISYIEKAPNGVKRKVAVINLPSFYADSRRGGRSCAKDVKKLLKEARKEKVDGVLLDLSTNGGGSLDDAVSVAGLFFKTGNVVTQSAKSNGYSQAPVRLKDDDDDVDWNGPLVVLTSRVSASASEIVAGTLKDYKRAIIVGSDHTFGKGSIQQVVSLPPGLGAIKVTVGMFFTPGGNSTQHRGVDADVVLPSALATDDVGEKSLDFSLPPRKIKPFLSKSAYVKSGKNKWNEVDDGILPVIKQRSKLRIAASDKFTEIIEDVKKAEKRGRIVTIGESLSEQKEKKAEIDKKKNFSKEEKLAEYLQREDIQEAALVLIDMIDHKGQVPLQLADEKKKKKKVGM